MNKVERSRIKLVLDDGIVDGKQKVINKTFSNLNPEASELDVLAAAQALSRTIERETLSVYRLDDILLIEE